MRELLEPVYREWRAGNWAFRPDVYADEMEWGWSDEFPAIAGVYHDPRTPNPRLQEWLASWDRWECEAEDYVCSGDTVVVLTRYRGRGRGSGIEMQTEGAHVWKFRGGRVVRLEIFMDRERALTALARRETFEGSAGTPHRTGRHRRPPERGAAAWGRDEGEGWGHRHAEGREVGEELRPVGAGRA